MSIPEMIAALTAAGMSQKEIADFAGCSQPTIHRAAKGAEILYSSGKRIEALYFERFHPNGPSLVAA